MSYAAHEKLTAPARPSAALWRLGLGIVLSVMVMLAVSRLVFSLMNAVLSDNAFETLAGDLQTGATPAGMLTMLVLMGALGVAAMVTVRVVHRRGAATLFGPWPAFKAQFLRVTVALGLLYLAMAVLPPWPKIVDPQPGLPPGTWLALLPLTLTALLIQTGSEELMFRGYLQSQLAARFRHPAIWLTVPSAVFAAGHYAPALFGSNALWITLWAFFFGLAAADLTARAGTLGPAIALHLVNNFIAIAIIAMPGDMSGLALYQLPFGPEDTDALRGILPLDLAGIFVSWLAARLALRV